MEKRRENGTPRYPTLLPSWTTFMVGWLIVHQAASFNYDYSSSCTKPYRSGRSHTPLTVPCDLNTQSYCNLPGASYPWHAVRRFVHENQGLMRRMYGDQRHISVLKAEIETNDIDSEYKPSRDDSYARNSKDHDILNTKLLYSKRPTGRSSEAYTVPHFRPVQTTPTSTKSKIVKEKEKQIIPQKKEENKTIIEKSSISKENSIKIKELEDQFKLASYKTSYLEGEITMSDEPNSNLEMNKIEPEIISLEAAIKQSIETNSVYPNYGVASKNITSSITSTSTSTTSSTTTDAKLPTLDTTTPEYVTLQDTTLTEDYDADITTTNTEEENGGWKPVAIDKLSTLSPTMLFSESVKNEKFSNDRIDSNEGENKKVEQPSLTPSVPTTGSHMEGQLYQDVAQEEVKPIVKLRGVNACPVKEEVVAPFWANNTRGEVLALLNLYPFEQYVHWEKCTNEHKQMFCRDGCRCEQQYRLHRLLAYDPNNECRGIFSDWFRFPSCCVCKCYDMPLEFRVTSRSPRSIEPEMDEAVKKEMYNQAASDWYTINVEE